MSDATRPLGDPPAPAAGDGLDARGESAVGTGRTAPGPAGASPAAAKTARPAGEGHAHGRAPLLAHEESEQLEQRLQRAVTGFVDGPRDAVAEADRVLEDIAARFTEAVTRRRRSLRMSWQNDDDKPAGTADTEQLRLALRDYRELAQRLLHG
jgi:hypothetical protein